MHDRWTSCVNSNKHGDNLESHSRELNLGMAAIASVTVRRAWVISIWLGAVSR
jgi:hypothetical protein